MHPRGREQADPHGNHQIENDEPKQHDQPFKLLSWRENNGAKL
jgi:hypothetical protein